MRIRTINKNPIHSLIGCGAGRVRRRPLGGFISRKEGEALDRHCAASLVQLGANTDRRVLRTSRLQEGQQRHFPHYRHERLERHSRDLRCEDRSDETSRILHALPAGERLDFAPKGSKLSDGRSAT